MYVELSCQSYYSFLKSGSGPDELVQQAIDVGLPALAVTDDHGVYGLPKAYRQQKDHPQFKLIAGSRLHIQNFGVLTLLARSRQGYGQMCKTLTAAFQGKQKGESFLTQDEFEKVVKGFGCPEWHVLVTAEQDIHWLVALFPERLHLMTSRFLDGKDSDREQQALYFAKKYSLPIVASNQVLYHHKDRRPLHDVLTCVSEGVHLGEAGFLLKSNAQRYLKTPFEMAKLFKDRPEWLQQSLKIAEDCHFSMSELRYYYPSEWIPKRHSAQSYLEELTFKGAKKRYPKGVPLKVQAQIQHELTLIAQQKFADYFLTIHDIVEYARGEDILCQGRGSAANSVVCYCLGITAIDPVRMNLLFERFISAERDEPPDIDVDFDARRREEVIQYVYNKYGRHRAAMVSAVVTYRTSSALREVSKVFGLPVGTLSSKKVESCFPDLLEKSPLNVREETIWQHVRQLKGFPRHLSIHSGGFTLSAQPLDEIVPIEPARMEGRTIIQWDKYDLETLGLLKVDILSLGMLNAMKRTLDLVGLDLYDVPMEDPKTYEMIQKADTVGVFQIESRAQMSMLGRLQPRNFYDLVVQVAIVRPGPIVGKMVHPYLKRRQQKEPVTYAHPKLKDILGKTLGVPLFQEQVMKMAIELADFTPGEADELRRAIGAWRSEGSIHKMGHKLMQGLMRNGLSEDFAARVFQQIQGFAQYGFPESHAASFALLAYVSSYLKCHYPAEFVASLINAQPMGFYAPHTLIHDAQRHGVKVLPVSLNHSQYETVLSGENEIRLGLHRVRHMSLREAHWVLEHRPFQKAEDFLMHCPLKAGALKSLAMAGAFGEFGFERRETLWWILAQHQRRFRKQLDLFDYQPEGPQVVGFAGMSLKEQIEADYQHLGLSHLAHPMQELRKSVRLPKMTSQSLREQVSGVRVEIAGLVLIKQRPGTAKGMLFCTLEDEHGYIDTATPPDVVEKYRDVFNSECFLIVTGVLQKQQNAISVLIERCRPVPIKDDDDIIEIKPRQYFRSL